VDIRALGLRGGTIVLEDTLKTRKDEDVRVDTGSGDIVTAGPGGSLGDLSHTEGEGGQGGVLISNNLHLTCDLRERGLGSGHSGHCHEDNETK